MISSSNNVKNKLELPYVKLNNIKNFDVNKIFDCGQCFRFDRVENSEHEKEFSGIAFGRFVSFAQDGDTVYIYNSTEEDFEKIWKHYLSLDVDYDEIRNDILSRSDNPDLFKALEYGDGIRILNQEPWETVCSFIISQNNNIPRIKKIIEALSQKCGSAIELPNGYEKHLSGRSSLYSFPTPEAILELGIDGLFELKTGFRAKYIYDAAQKTKSGELDYDKIFDVCTMEAVDILCGVKGIGPKVASCALLFSFEKYDAFPIDVWIKKVIAKYFSDGDKKFDPQTLGKYAGIAQQYLFYYERYLIN
jgi:N-glycosylase/DNA lyase